MHQIGVGVLGPVYRTYEPQHDRLVAVKAFHLDITPEQVEVFASALTALVSANLSHSSIVPPIAAGVSDEGVPYLAQEYVAAESLDVAIRHYAPAPLATALPFISQLAEAIDFAHGRGVLYGALHLRDIFVTPDQARAGGFGIVTALEQLGLRSPIRRPYAAPEQIAGVRWGPEADRFALAAIAYELVTGQRVAGAGDPVGDRLETIDGVASIGALMNVFVRALAEDPERRYSSGAAFVRAIRSAIQRADEAREDRPRAGDRVAIFSPRRPTRVSPQPHAQDGELFDEIERRQAKTVEHSESRAPAGAASDLKIRDEAAPAQAVGGPGAAAATSGEQPVASTRGKPWSLGEPDLERVDRLLAEREALAPDSALVGEAPAAEMADRSAEMPHEGTPDIAPEQATEKRHADEVVEARTMARAARPPDLAATQPKRAMLPVALAVTVAILVAYVVFLGLSGERNQPVDEVRSPSAPDSGAREFSERTVTEDVGQLPRTNDPAVAPPSVAPSIPPEAPEPEQVPTREPATQAPSPPQSADTLSRPDSSPSAPPATPSRSAARPAAEPAAGPAASAPKPEPARPQAPAVGPSGWVLVRTSPPGAQVAIDGQPRGTTPLSLRNVALGPHAVQVSLGGYEPHAQEVVLSRDEPVAAVNVTLTARGAAVPAAQAGTVLVESRPAGAHVFLDGKLIGTTPLQTSTVTPGRHDVRIQLDGYQAWSTAVDVSAGQRTRVGASLDRIPGR